MGTKKNRLHRTKPISIIVIRSMDDTIGTESMLGRSHLVNGMLCSHKSRNGYTLVTHRLLNWVAVS